MTTLAPIAVALAKPYKGPESYQVEDSDIFYGRDREAEQLIAKILSSRFTLVHAQSGAGKTSLLNARVIPELEARGWNAFRVLPHNDPVESLRAATLRYILPPPGSELTALTRASEQLNPGGEDLTLGELLGLYDELDVKDLRRRELVGPVSYKPPVTGGKFRELGDVVPIFSRLLRSHVEVESLSEHFGVLWCQGASGSDGTPPPVTAATRISALSAMLEDERMARGYERLFEELDVPVPELRVFFENLCEVYGGQRTRFALVIILDQFEELFTRFVDPGPASTTNLPDLPDWRLRKEFFEQFARLYGADAGQANADEQEAEAEPPVSLQLPIRYVISMRDEYIAHLDPLRPLVGSFDDVSFHLNLLEREQAQTAIREPAKHFGYSYSAECYEEIIKQLTKEDRFVEPAHLQLVCERLWNEEGAKLSHLNTDDGQDAEQRQIPLDTFRELGGTKGILNSFFLDFLESFGDKDKERLEALEMLEPLVTASGTRNIVERSCLIDAPFRDSARRGDLLKKMADHTIVRTERRLGGFFVEITHEFLIGPILDAMRETLTNDIEYGRFRWSIRALERLQGVGRGPGRLLSEQEFNTLYEHRDDIRWNRWGMEVMIRSAICHAADRKVLRYWLEAYNRLDHSRDVSTLLEERMVLEEGRDLLSLADLRVVNQQRERLKLTARQLEYVLRSTLANSDDRERGQIRYWMKRMLQDAQ
jgi:hypothetical protein